ncbi:hypothetical protein QBC39DRAFT_347380 [Podospora conica]|nr:hypothetical protein QBC39DRAFT_347380 [Schizothecium conicum]
MVMVVVVLLLLLLVLVVMLPRWQQNTSHKKVFLVMAAGSARCVKRDLRRRERKILGMAGESSFICVQGSLVMALVHWCRQEGWKTAVAAPTGLLPWPKGQRQVLSLCWLLENRRWRRSPVMERNEMPWWESAFVIPARTVHVRGQVYFPT